MSKTGLHIFNQCTVVWDVMRVWEFFKDVCVFFPRLTGFRIFLLFFIWWYTCVHLSYRALECKNTIDVCIKMVGLVQQVFWGMKNKLFKYRRIEVEVLHTVATNLLFFFQGWIFVWCVCSSGLVLLIKKGLRLKQEICMV